METKFESQKKALKEDFSEEQKEWDLELTAKRNEINSITEDLKTSHGLLKDITREFLRFEMIPKQRHSAPTKLKLEKLKAAYLLGALDWLRMN